MTLEGMYADGPAQIITTPLVGGLKPPELKAHVKASLAVQGKWKGDPELLQGVVRGAVLDRRVVERADIHRRAAGRTAPRGKGGQHTGKAGSLGITVPVTPEAVLERL